MKSLTNIEFFTTPQGEVMICESGKDTRLYDMSRDYEFTSIMIANIREFYPKAYEALCTLYNKSAANLSYYEFLIVSRFIKCNFGEFDNRLDINHVGAYNFEFVRCPLRGECKVCGIVCSPEFCSTLSKKELDVMQLFYEGKDEGQIADMLYISIHTVRQHKRNALTKLDLHSLKEFILYAKNNNLFNE